MKDILTIWLLYLMYILYFNTPSENKFKFKLNDTTYEKTEEYKSFKGVHGSPIEPTYSSIGESVALDSNGRCISSTLIKK